MPTKTETLIRLFEDTRKPGVCSVIADLLAALDGTPAPCPIECTDKTHWWARTPPVPHVPPGYVAEDALCQCGRFRYAQWKELLRETPSVGIGTFVPEDDA